jgi:hypothetical protein
LVAPRDVFVTGASALTLPLGVVFPAVVLPAGRDVSAATVTAFAAAPRVVFADFAGVDFADAAALLPDLEAADFVAADFVAADLGVARLAAAALVAADLAVPDLAVADLAVLDFTVTDSDGTDFATGLVGVVLFALGLAVVAFAGLALLAPDVPRAVETALAGVAFAVVTAGRFAAALAGSALAAGDAFFAVRPDAAALDTVAEVARARPAVLVAATERPA